MCCQWTAFTDLIYINKAGVKPALLFIPALYRFYVYFHMTIIYNTSDAFVYIGFFNSCDD